MKDRLLTFALAIGALVAFYAVMAPKPSAPEQKATRPISVEAGPNGYLGLVRWLEAERVPVISLRERFGKLHEVPGLESTTGNLLISTAPHLYPIRDSEVLPLRSWIAQGNTLLVIAGLSDTPDWSMEEGVDPAFLEHLQAMTQMSFSLAPGSGELVSQPKPESGPSPGADSDSEDDTPSWTEAFDARTRLKEPLRFEMQPSGQHPLLERVTKVRALSEYPTSKWDGWFEQTGVLELAREPDSTASVL